MSKFSRFLDHAIHTLLLIVLSISSSLGFSATEGGLFLVAKNAIPPGFEVLAGQQRGLADVYFSGEFIAPFNIDYSPGTIRFSEPEKVIAALGEIDPETSHRVLSVLGGELSSNSAKICRDKRQTDCGELEPTVAAVIFDESMFRIDVFVNKDFRTLYKEEKEKYLPASSAQGLSVSQTLGTVYSRTSESSDDYSFFGNSALSFGESSISSEWDYNKLQGSRVESLYYQRDYRGKEMMVGAFRSSSNGLSLSSSQRILGLRLSSSMNTRVDRESSQSNDIQMFLATPSQVDVLKDGRLIATKFYGAGNRLLDTDSLPSGAYDIALRITDELGQARLERRFFVKELAIPPKDELQYYLELGQGLDQVGGDALPQTADHHLARAGLRKRIKEDIGVEVALSQSDGISVFEAGGIFLGRQHRTQLSALLSADGDAGYTFGSRFQRESFSLTLDSRQLWRSGQNQNQSQFAPTFQANAPLPDDVFNFLPDSYNQHSLGLNYALNRGSISARMAYYDNDFGESQTISSINYNLTLIQNGRDSLAFSAAVSHRDEELVATIGLVYTLRSDHWSHTASPQVRHRARSGSNADTYGRVGLRSSWRDNDKLPGDLRVTARSILDDGRDSQLGLEADYASRFGRAALNVEHSLADDGFATQGTRVAFNASTGIASNLEDVAWGGSNQNQSAVLIDIEGDADKADFDVYVDGYRQGYARLGSTGVIQLTPFQDYSIRIEPRDSTFVGYEDKPQRATLYPGNVVKLHWEANEIMIGYGRIVDAAGRPMRNALLEGAYGPATTDNYGIFQLESLSTTRTIKVSTDGKECSIELPVENNQRNGVYDFGQLVCEQQSASDVARERLRDLPSL